MIVKILIIVAIFVVGGIVLFPQNQDFFSSDINETKDDITNLKDDTFNKAEETVDNTVEKITSTIDDTIDTIGSKISDLNSEDFISAHGLLKKEPTYFGQVFEKNSQEKTCQISIPEMAQTVNGQKELTHIISLEDCEFEVNDSVQITNSHTGRSSSGISKFFTSVPQSSTLPADTTQPVVDLTPSSLIFDTLSLSTVRSQTNDVLIQYEDTSGGTISVTVTLRNAEKELFSGVFYASKFGTSVNDISDTPHIVEMVVEHAVHRTITSSVFNPAGSFDNTINGIFIKNS